MSHPHPIVGMIDPTYYKHINGLLSSHNHYDMRLCSRILATTSTIMHAVCDKYTKKDKLMHILYRLSYIRHKWSDKPRTDGSLGWLPFVSIMTCSVVLKNDPKVSMRFLCPDQTITMRPGEFVIYDYDTAPYHEVCPRDGTGEYRVLNIHYLFIPRWLPLPIFRFYKWLYINTECLQIKLNGLYLTALLLYKWLRRS